MRSVIESLERNKIRNNIKVIVGGAPITNEIVKEIYADGYGKDAIDAVKIAKSLIIR